MIPPVGNMLIEYRQAFLIGFVNNYSFNMSQIPYITSIVFGLAYTKYGLAFTSAINKS